MPRTSRPKRARSGEIRIPAAEPFPLAGRLDLLAFETEARAKGYRCVAGIDEAGRGPLAGPVVAAAVILPPDAVLDGLTDSKLLTPSQRERWFEQIRVCAIAWSVAAVSEREIDELNILQATRKAMKQAVELLSHTPDYLLIDGTCPIEVEIPQLCIKKGDRRSLSVAAASVLAKVTRDRIMDAAHRLYPQYGFDRNKGYGSPAHLRALRIYGCCPVHRKSFGPVREVDPKAAREGRLPFPE